MHHACFSADARRTLIAVGAAGIAALLLGACGSSGSSSATTAAGAGTTTTSTAKGSSGSSSDAASIQALTNDVQSASHATYRAVYTAHTSSGTDNTITLEQMPPKSVFGAGSGGVAINDGTHTYFCSDSGGHQQCVSYGTGAANPLASLAAIFSPQTVLNAFHSAEAAVDAHSAGYSLAFSTASYAGQSSKCVDFTGNASLGKYCVTNSGVLAYVQAPGGTFTLTSYSSSPPASDFALPAGATVVTVPSISSPG